MRKEQESYSARRSSEGPKASLPERVEFSAGQHIESAAQQLVGAARMSGGHSVGAFNGVELSADPETDPASILVAYRAEMEHRAAKWKASPEGLKAALDGALEIAGLQARSDALLSTLPDLDFGDHHAVLNWLGALQPASDRIGVTMDRAEVVKVFDAHNLHANACCGAAFDAEDRDTVYLWLVGQALDGLARAGAIHPIFHRFAEEWRQKFGADLSGDAGNGTAFATASTVGTKGSDQ